MKVDLCFVISHGFAARMLLQTGLVVQLLEAGKRVAIITTDATDKNFDDFQEHSSVSIIEQPDQKNLWSENYQFKRMYYLEDFRNNTALLEKHKYAIWFNTSKHPWRRVRPFYYYIIYRLIRFLPAIRERFKKREKQYLESPTITKTIERIQPDLVVSTYPVDLLEARFLFAARQKGIKTLIHLLSWDNITCKGIFPAQSDYYITWGEVMSQELEEYYSPDPEKVFVCGVPHFDAHWKIKQDGGHQELFEELGLDPNLPYLFLAMSAPRFAPGEVDIVEWLAEKIQKNEFGSHLQLIVRPHPQNVTGFMADKKWLKRLEKLKGNKVVIDYPQLVNSKVRWSMQKTDMDRLSKLLLGCNLCINSGSTVSIDALTFDKPVMLTSFDGDRKLPYWKSAKRLVDYPHLKKLVASGGVEVASSFVDMERLIRHYLNHPNDGIDKRKEVFLNYCYQNDGKATKRAVQSMLKVLHTIQKIEGFGSEN